MRHVNQENSLHECMEVFDIWQCRDQDRAQILGKKPDEITAEHTDCLACAGMVVSIHQTLTILFSHSDKVREWLNKPNFHPDFLGRSALTVMLEEGQAGARKVEKLTKAWALGHVELWPQRSRSRAAMVNALNNGHTQPRQPV